MLPDRPVDPSQGEIRDWFAGLGRGEWLPLDIRSRMDGWVLGLYSALAPTSSRAIALSRPGWNLLRGTHGPGFVQEAGDTRYQRISSDPFEPIAIEREYHGMRPSELELSEEFRLYHNLWSDGNGRYFRFDDAGNEEEAARVSPVELSVRSRLLRQYQAARGLDLLLFIESDLWLPDDEGRAEAVSWQSDQDVGEVFAGKAGEHPLTRLIATRVIPAPPIEEAGMWPYEPPDDNFPTFIIGIDPAGKEIRHSCDPDGLANYFGKNPGAPLYMTPVHFTRDVLVRYFDRPDKYAVEDGYLRCQGLWGLRLDNDDPKRVVVALGDLGRDLPSSERTYWLAFNIRPDGTYSETAIRRSFLGEFADPSSPDLLFRGAYEGLRASWLDRFGWSLYRDPSELDASLLAAVRRPLHDTEKEFEELVDVLTKLMVDLLNDAAIVADIGRGPADERSIAKLERWLTAHDADAFEPTIEFLRALYGVRSQGTAHAKGSGFDRAVTRLVGARRRADAAVYVLDEALKAIRWLTSVATATTELPDAEDVPPVSEIT